MINLFKKVGFKNKSNPAKIPGPSAQFEDKLTPMKRTATVSEVIPTRFSLKIMMEGQRCDAKLEQPEKTSLMKAGDEVEVLRGVGQHFIVRSIGPIPKTAKVRSLKQTAIHLPQQGT